MGLETVRTHGTTAALALLNDQVKRVECGLTKLVAYLVPLSQYLRTGMIAAVQNGSLNLEKLEAMTAICSVVCRYDCYP